MSNKVYIGIDTSNYTTSIAVCNEDGEIIANIKTLLDVKAGERGLRQSDAVVTDPARLVSDRVKGDPLAGQIANGIRPNAHFLLTHRLGLKHESDKITGAKSLDGVERSVAVLCGEIKRKLGHGVT